MVLLTIEIARKSLSDAWWSLTMFNMMAVGFFLAPLFRGMPAEHLLFLLGATGCIGLPIGVYLTFRSVEGTGTALFRIIYAGISLEFLFTGGCAAFTAFFAKRSDLNWLAFLANGVVMALSLLGGMYREAKALDLFNQSRPNRWRSVLEKHIDYTTYRVLPSLPRNYANKEAWQNSTPFWIMAIAAISAPTLFQIFGGGRNKAIFVLMPVLIVCFAVFNLENCGPRIVRLMLLRQLEKEHGRRFINADLEQIQELRCTFFLARWLVKDYAPPKPPKPHELAKVVLKEKKPLRRKKKRK